MPSTEIILTENIPGLGTEADVVKVRRGFARNFLCRRANLRSHHIDDAEARHAQGETGRA